MPGINLGSKKVKQVNLGSKVVKEVWKGSTKLWPTSKWVATYGIQSMRISLNQTLFWGTETVTFTTPAGTGYSGILFPNNLVPYAGSHGNTCKTAADTNRSKSFLLEDATNPNDNKGIGHHIIGGSFGNGGQAWRRRVPIEQDGGKEETIARFDKNGNLLWADRAGWSCVRESAGTYLVTGPPGSFKHDYVIASVGMYFNYATYGANAMAQEVNVTPGTVRIYTKYSTATNYDMEFCVLGFVE